MTTQGTQYARSLIEASLDPLFTIAPNRTITDLNNAFADLVGVSRRQALGADFFTFFPDAEKVNDAFQQLLSGSNVVNHLLNLKGAQEANIEVVFHGSVFCGAHGAIEGMIVVVRPVSRQQLVKDLNRANKQLAFQNIEKQKRADELDIANLELAYQNEEKETRAAELVVANVELAYQNDEKEKRAAELVVANIELAFQTDEKEKRAAELVLADKELDFQNTEKEKQQIVNKELAELSNSLKLASQYSLSLIEASLDPLVTINTEGKIMDMNEATVRITGISRQELKGADFFNYFTNSQKAREVYQQVFANGFVTDAPLTLKHTNGKLTDVLFNGSVYKDTEGVVLGVVVVARDVTAQNILSNYSHSLIEASRDPLFTISAKGIITDVNNATVEITEQTREQLIGADFNDYFTDTEQSGVACQSVFSAGYLSDFPLVVKDGKLTDVLFNGAVYKDDSGNVLGAVLVGRVVTEQKRIEKELIEARDFAELATEVAEEAKNYAESATQLAKESVKAKQQFLSNMSHEIRTPMNAIIGFTKVALKTELTAKQREYLTAIKISGDALIVLINDILDLAKVDSGKMIFEKIPFKMVLSIAAMLHLFEPKIQEKNLMLIKEYDPLIPEVLLGDPVRLHQIILNLVSNAVKFTTVGAITVSVLKVAEDEKQVTIEFTVSDTGVGIPSAKIGSIFENFQQASSDTSRLYGGTGLGLAIVKQLVESQGGDITVKSEVNVGSSFSFHLPFEKTKQAPETDSGEPELDKEVKHIKVLVVEDIALNQLLMKTLLDDFGFERDIASNGLIAIEKLALNTYDIILMDLQMPVMNGFEATAHIRNIMNLKIPIIALTADVTTADLEKCKSVGMNNYVAKPIDERLLYNKIVAAVKKPLPVETITQQIEPPEMEKFTDLNYLMKRTKANPDLMMELISAYLEQTPPLVSAMKQSLMDKNWALLNATIHKIIPSFSIMGMSPDFVEIAKKVQDFANTQVETVVIAELINKIEHACARACKELEAEFNTIKQSKI